MNTAEPSTPADIAQTIAGPHRTNADTTPAADEANAGEELRQRMGVRIGALQLLIPVDAGREVIPPPPISRIPYTASWLRGLANVRGGVVPVVDLAAALETGAGVTRQPYLLISGHGEAAMGLLIDGLPRLVNLTAADRPTEPRQIAPLLQDAIISAYERDGGVWLEVDLPILFDTITRNVTLGAVTS